MTKFKDVMLITLAVTTAVSTSIAILNSDNPIPQCNNNELFKLQIEYNNLIDTCERLDMLNDLNYIEDFLNGVYKSGQYYCVWTGNRTTNEINETQYHEACHHLVYLNKKHFCR
jgi:hypothetical protein